jgi:hypothetical protein
VIQRVQLWVEVKAAKRDAMKAVYLVASKGTRKGVGKAAWTAAWKEAMKAGEWVDSSAYTQAAEWVD